MRVYGTLPPSAHAMLRSRVIVPAKKLASRGVIQQPGFVLARRLDHSIPFKLVREGTYEPELDALFRAVLRPGDIVFDVGANVGFFTLLAAALVGSRGQVHAFEPNPGTFAALRHNVHLNIGDQVRLHSCACSDTPGKVHLYFGQGVDSGLASLRQTSDLLKDTVVCRAITLDDYVTSQRVGKVRLLKMDIEGGELLALCGATGLLSGPNTPDVIALELIASHAAAFGVTPDDITSFLANKGYDLFLLAPDPVTGCAIIHLPVPHQDGTLIAMQPQAREHVRM